VKLHYILATAAHKISWPLYKNRSITTGTSHLLNNTKNMKASGIDYIPMELWKDGGKALYIRLVRLCYDIWTQGNTPSDWKSSLLIPTHKKDTKAHAHTIGESTLSNSLQNICSNFEG
jgi:hypothetical protein